MAIITPANLIFLLKEPIRRLFRSCTTPMVVIITGLPAKKVANNFAMTNIIAKKQTAL